MTGTLLSLRVDQRQVYCGVRGKSRQVVKQNLLLQNIFLYHGYHRRFKIVVILGHLMSPFAVQIVTLSNETLVLRFNFRL